jgi:hypothetical protein
MATKAKQGRLFYNAGRDPRSTGTGLPRRNTKSGKRDHHGDRSERHLTRNNPNVVEVNSQEHNFAGAMRDRVRLGGNASARGEQQAKAVRALNNLEPNRKGVAIHPAAGGRPNRKVRYHAFVNKNGEERYLFQTRKVERNGKPRWGTDEVVNRERVVSAARQIGSGRAKRAIIGG